MKGGLHVKIVYKIIWKPIPAIEMIKWQPSKNNLIYFKMKTLGKLNINTEKYITTEELMLLRGGNNGSTFYGCDCKYQGSWIGYWNGWWDTEAQAINDSEDHFEDCYHYPEGSIDCTCCVNC